MPYVADCICSRAEYLTQPLEHRRLSMAISLAADWLQSLPQQTKGLWLLAFDPACKKWRSRRGHRHSCFLVSLRSSGTFPARESRHLRVVSISGTQVHKASFSTMAVMNQSTRRGQASRSAGCSPPSLATSPTPNSANSLHKDHLPSDS